MARKIDTMTAEEIKAVLENLISSAETIDRYEDSIFTDERSYASYETRELIDSLIELDKEA